MNPHLEVRETAQYGKSNEPHLVNKKKVYRKIDGQGKAVFATKEIKKGEMLFVMGGYILDIEDENNLSGIVADKPIEISEYFSIGPRTPADLKRMPQHYVNHSCDPNAGFRGQIFMVAMKQIKPGDEIVYDYAMVMHANKDSDTYYEFDCCCNTKRCRSKVGENDWQKPDLQKRYDGYFQYFLQEKVNRKKKRACK